MGGGLWWPGFSEGSLGVTCSDFSKIFGLCCFDPETGISVSKDFFFFGANAVLGSNSR